MACPLLGNPSDVIVAFSVRYVLNGTLSGSVTFLDPSCDNQMLDGMDCGDASVCTPIQASLGAVTSVPCGDCADLSDDPCFSEDPDWVAGIIKGQRLDGLYHGMPSVTFELVAYSEYLENKPISTQLYRKASLSVVLSEIASYYAGIPAGFRDFSPINNSITGPIVGNSVMQELSALAAAGYSHLFTQVGGELTIEPWKTNLSSTDYTIPSSLIFDVKKQPMTPNRVTFIRARGAGVSKYECGKQIFTDSRIDPSNNGGYSGIGGTLTSTAISGMKTPSLDLSLDNLAGSKEDIRNSSWTSETASPGDLVESEDGSLKTTITKDDGSWFDDTPVEYKIQIAGKRRPDYEADGVAEKLKPNTKELQAMASKDHDRWAVLSPHPMPQGSFFSESLPFGAPSPSYNGQSASIENIETLISDARLSDCGYKLEQISAQYSHVKEHLFLQGVRRFQEMRMLENIYVLDIGYMPCLKLNQVVEFPISGSEGCSKPQNIKGVIAGIDVNFKVNEDGTPDVGMTLTVWGLDCIGSNVYTSANLMINKCAGSEAGGDNPWTTSVLGLDQHAAVDGNCGFIYAVGFPSLAFFSLVHTDYSIGDTYTLSFQYETLLGAEAMVVGWTWGSTALSGTGSFSVPFIPLATSGNLIWAIGNTSQPTAYKVCNMQITKTVIA